jgi:hypothetical protein
MIMMASKGHFLTQIPQPMHSSSEIQANLLLLDTSMHSFPTFTTGHDFLHSCLHFFGLHLSSLTIAIRVNVSSGSSFFLAFGAILAATTGGTLRVAG